MKAGEEMERGHQGFDRWERCHFHRQMKEWVLIVRRDGHGIWLSDATVATTTPEGAEGGGPQDGMPGRGLSLKNSSVFSAPQQPLSTPPPFLHKASLLP